MQASKALIEKIIQMAQLEVTAEEFGHLQKDISQIATWIEQLKEVDTQHHEPLLTISPAHNRLREDVPAPTPPIAELLRNAPKSNGQYFQVPAVKKK